MIRYLETQTTCFWRAAHALRQPTLQSDDRQSAARLLVGVVRHGATTRLKAKAGETLKRNGFVAFHTPVIDGPEAA
jgi:hypothetical protein